MPKTIKCRNYHEYENFSPKLKILESSLNPQQKVVVPTNYVS
ncbi:hypothetical protein LEP1GSC132_0559 [Leptospira kirschneri str. 200803703]|nr:hypothetical protein LEP1GSC132_0559 [Leptospira kirschneri str. 200803703]